MLLGLAFSNNLKDCPYRIKKKMSFYEFQSEINSSFSQKDGRKS